MPSYSVSHTGEPSQACGSTWLKMWTIPFGNRWLTFRRRRTTKATGTWWHSTITASVTPHVQGLLISTRASHYNTPAFIPPKSLEWQNSRAWASFLSHLLRVVFAKGPLLVWWARRKRSRDHTPSCSTRPTRFTSSSPWKLQQVGLMEIALCPGFSLSFLFHFIICFQVMFPSYFPSHVSKLFPSYVSK